MLGLVTEVVVVLDQAWRCRLRHMGRHMGSLMVWVVVRMAMVVLHLPVVLDTHIRVRLCIICSLDLRTTTPV